MGYNVTPSAVRTTNNRNYVNSQAISSSITNLNLEKPIVDPNLVRGFRGLLTTFVSSMGAMNGVDNPWYSHVEKDWIREIVKPSASVAAGSTAGASVNISAASGYVQNISNSAAPEYFESSTSAAYVPAVGDILVVPNGASPVQVLVTAVSAAQFTIFPLLAGDTIPAVGTSTEIVRIGTAFPEGSSAAAPRASRISGYENNLQSFRDAFKVTGSASTSVTWLENLGESGNGYAWYLEGIRDTVDNHETDCEVTMLVGEKATNTTLAAVAGQGTTTTTEGLTPFVESNGQREDYASAIDLGDIADMSKALWKYQGAKENYLWVGHGLSVSIDDLLRTSSGLTAGGIMYSNISEDKAANLNFKSFTYGNVTYHKNVLEAYTQPNLLNATGLQYDIQGLVIPADNVNAPKDGLRGQTESVPSLRINYLDREDAVNGYKEWATGAAILDTPTDDEDAMTIHILSQKGFEGFAGHRFGQFYT